MKLARAGFIPRAPSAAPSAVSTLQGRTVQSYKGGGSAYFKQRAEELYGTIMTDSGDFRVLKSFPRQSTSGRRSPNGILSGISSLLFSVLGLCLASHLPLRAQSPGALPGTAHWDFPQDMATQQHIELRNYFETRIAAARQRDRFWDGADWNQTVEQNRDELRRTIGAVEQFLPPGPKTKQLGSTPAFTYSLVEWPVLRLGGIGSTAGSSGTVVKQ